MGTLCCCKLHQGGEQGAVSGRSRTSEVTEVWKSILQWCLLHSDEWFLNALREIPQAKTSKLEIIKAQLNCHLTGAALTIIMSVSLSVLFPHYSPFSSAISLPILGIIIPRLAMSLLMGKHRNGEREE